MEFEANSSELKIKNLEMYATINIIYWHSFLEQNEKEIKFLKKEPVNTKLTMRLFMC